MFFFWFRVKKTDIIDLSWGTSFFSAKSPGPMKFLNPTVTVERNMEQKSDLSRCCGGSDRHRRDREWKDHADHPVYGRGWEYLVSDSVSVCENCQVKEMFAQQYFKCFHWLASFCLGRVSRNLRFQNPAGLKQKPGHEIMKQLAPRHFSNGPRRGRLHF